MPKREYQPKTVAQRHAAFEASLRDGGYGHDVHRWPFHCNADLIAAYGGAIGDFGRADWLDRDAFVARFERVRQTGVVHHRTKGLRLSSDDHPTWTAYRNGGNCIHWGLRLGLLAEAEVDGVRGWQILDWDPHWRLDLSRPGAELVRVKGGTPAEQAERARLAKKDATRSKLRATLARKACAKATTEVGQWINFILRAEPTFRIPDAWATKGFVPGALAGAHLSACSPSIREACVVLEFDKWKLAEWLRLLHEAEYQASCRAWAKTKAAEEAGRREDDQALAELGGL
ncbi:hypothetical protein ACRAWG_32535 [Methylobacterium sp. P31]